MERSYIDVVKKNNHLVCQHFKNAKIQYHGSELCVPNKNELKNIYSMRSPTELCGYDIAYANVGTNTELKVPYQVFIEWTKKYNIEISNAKICQFMTYLRR
jgi:hypothetical protein